MPKAKKRVVKDKKQKEDKHYDVSSSKWGKILILILCISMVAGLAFAAIYLMIQAL